MRPPSPLAHLEALYVDLLKGKKRKGQAGYYEATDSRGRKTWRRETRDVHQARLDLVAEWEREPHLRRMLEERAPLLGLRPVAAVGSTVRMHASRHTVPKGSPREHAAFHDDEVLVEHGGFQTADMVYRRAEVRSTRRYDDPHAVTDRVLEVLRRRRSLRIPDLARALHDVPRETLHPVLIRLHQRGVVTLHPVEHSGPMPGLLRHAGRTYHAVSLV